MNQWIPVTDHLPDNPNNQLITYKVHALFDHSWTTLPTPQVTIDSYNNQLWSKAHEMSSPELRIEVTHWMPLPEPPKEPNHDVS